MSDFPKLGMCGLLGVHPPGNKRSFFGSCLIPNDPLQGPEDDLCQLSMPVRPEVPSALHAWNGPCADPLHAASAITISLEALHWSIKNVYTLQHIGHDVNIHTSGLGMLCSCACPCGK